MFFGQTWHEQRPLTNVIFFKENPKFLNLTLFRVTTGKLLSRFLNYAVAFSAGVRSRLPDRPQSQNIHDIVQNMHDKKLA